MHRLALYLAAPEAMAVAAAVTEATAVAGVAVTVAAIRETAAALVAAAEHGQIRALQSLEILLTIHLVSALFPQLWHRGRWAY